MTKIEAIRYLQEQGRDLGWIANVFSIGGGPNGAKTLKAIASLVRRGYEVSSLQFVMPYERMLVNGDGMTPAQVREMAEASYSRGAKLRSQRRSDAMVRRHAQKGNTSNRD